MRVWLLAIVAFATLTSAAGAQTYTRRNGGTYTNETEAFQRFNYGGYYTGNYYRPGYSYFPRTGMNRLQYQSGGFWYHNGYQPPHMTHRQRGATLGFPGTFSGW